MPEPLRIVPILALRPSQDLGTLADEFERFLNAPLLAQASGRKDKRLGSDFLSRF